MYHKQLNQTTLFTFIYIRAKIFFCDFISNMKADKITFGQSYIKPSLVEHMSKANLEKIPYIVGLGEFYPADIFIGANMRGQLTLDIIHSTPAKQLFFSNEIPKTIENVSILNFLHNMDRCQRKNYGIRTPIFKTVIENIDNLSIKELQLAVNDKIKFYYEKLANKFFN